MPKRETPYQAELKDRISARLPGCLIFKQDPNLTHQGIPDLLVLYNDRWAMLEVKRSANEAHQPNQDYWVDQYNGLSFAAFIYPENEEEILDALQSALQARCERYSRSS